MKNSSILVAIASASLLSACGSSSSSQADPLSCTNYCNTVTAACTAANDQYNFIDNKDCLNYCNTVQWTPGTIDPNAHENTLGCRIAHAQLAASPGPASVHCWHAGPTGGALCGTYCESYCELALEACTGTNQLYPDKPTCQTACNGIAVSADATVKTGNNVQCRIWHLSEAMIGNATQKATHCPHGAVTSPVCI